MNRDCDSIPLFILSCCEFIGLHMQHVLSPLFRLFSPRPDLPLKPNLRFFLRTSSLQRRRPSARSPQAAPKPEPLHHCAASNLKLSLETGDNFFFRLSRGAENWDMLGDRGVEGVAGKVVECERGWVASPTYCPRM